MGFGLGLEMNGGAGGELSIKRKGSCIKPALEVDMRMTYLRRDIYWETTEYKVRMEEELFS